ncbi:hypothetical protein LJR074_001842 [Acidovorax sp. LjRoot74]|jgi:hypothetical protein|uniref:OST-HTH/LOTUS domain-containing protein n=1 Tax=Acidovorax sp. LjRoot74 TaxID=3342337 RepID=UPI003ECC940B
MTTDLLPPEKLGPEIQLEVQRLLGRCMVRIQQYEKSLKVLLAHHELAGPAETLEVQQTLRAQKLSNQTLGQLAGLLFETFVVPEGFERELLPEDKTPTDRISFAHSFRITQAPEQWEQTKAAIQELVSLRNELVHHFLYRFDLWDEQGCINAMAYLQEAFQRIDTHYQELRAWLMTLHQGRVALASFVQSDAYLNLLINGINPDGSFEWRDTGIVRALREEVQALASDDGVPLKTLQAQMHARHPTQTPQKYRCSSWQQVLTESCEFDLTYRRDSQTGPKTAWVRLRPPSPPRSGTKERKRPGRGAVTPPTDPAPEPA